MSKYSVEFYENQRSGSKRSAEIILPIVFDAINPTSVVDVGCGVGTWLAAAHKLGVPSLLGFEGEWVTHVLKDQNGLDIRIGNLEHAIDEQRRFDLAICLEVAEHLSNRRGPSLIQDLCNLSEVVLFSAAIPGQGGTTHINEQWQDYWATLFESNGYSAFDIVRPAVWTNDEVDFWYRQNILLYANSAATKRFGNIPKATMLSVIHPEFFGYELPPGPSYLVRNIPRSVRKAIKRRLAARSSESGLR